MSPCKPRLASKRLVLATVMLSMIIASPQAASFADEVEARKTIESLSAEQLEQLRRKQERFSRMTPQEQQRIRDLHDSLSKHKDAERLTGVMEKYAAWLRGLPASRRAELLTLTGKERLERMKEIIRREERERFMQLAADQLKREDREALYGWIRDFAIARRADLEPLIPEYLQKRYKELSDERVKTGVLVGTLFAKPEQLTLNASEVKGLESVLSEKAREALRKSGSTAEQSKLITDWIAIVRASQFQSRFRGPREPVSQEELTAFFEKLSDEEQERLKSLPSEKMQRELEWKYRYSRRFGPRARPGFGGGRGGFGGGRGGRGGNGEPRPGEPRGGRGGEPPRKPFERTGESPRKPAGRP